MKVFLFSLFSLVSLVANATIITGYANPSGFYPSSNPSAIFDLDNNGQFDFLAEIVDLGSSNYIFKIKGMNGTQIETDGTLNALGYNAGTPLGSNSYKDSAFVKAPYFPENSVRFVGFKFKINGQYCCGYMEVRPTSYYQGFFSLYNYGYETNSSICIETGAVATSILGSRMEDMNAIITNNIIYIKAVNKIDYNIEIIDITGKELYKSQDNIGNMEIPVGNFPKNVLFILVTDRFMESRKIIKILNR